MARPGPPARALERARAWWDAHPVDYGSSTRAELDLDLQERMRALGYAGG